MKFSVIIPFRKLDEYAKEAVDGVLKQGYKDYELILLPDEKIENKWKNKKIKIIVTGAVKPARKRNIGSRNSKGELLAFVDSDAVAREDWLENSLRYFKDKNIGAAGGPNVIPKGANLWEHVSGDILGSFACGTASIRYKVYNRVKEVKELPSCNLLVRKEAFIKLGGFDETLLTAEDSKLCFDLKEKLGMKVIYGPDVLVYHHRRNSIQGHLRQMWIYGRDIAWLLKKEFKLWKLYYGLPT
ncbi:glycosyltransferase, partial [Candidatus Woesearchaeota archaeon]|nr:glycosyltransferase [Candidatus Woesearchaeota archaeon]